MFDSFAESKGDVPIAHLVDQLIDDFPVQEFQHTRAFINKCDLHAQGGEHRRILDADNTSSHYHHTARQPCELHDPIAGDHDIAVRLHSWRRSRQRTDGEQNISCGHGTPAANDRTDRYALLDVMAFYQLFERMRFYLRSDNLTNNQPIVARRPFGARPSKPLLVQVGIKIEL